MYVCLCNGLTDRQVRGHAARSEGSPARLYECLGVRPKCGKCVPMVREILRGAQDGSPAGGLVPLPSSS